MTEGEKIAKLSAEEAEQERQRLYEAYRNAGDSDRLGKEIEFLRFDTAFRINQLEEKIIEDRLELTALSATLSSLIEEVNTIRKGR